MPLLNTVNFKRIEQVVLIQCHFTVVKGRNYSDSSSTLRSNISFHATACRPPTVIPLSLFAGP